MLMIINLKKETKGKIIVLKRERERFS